MLARSARTCSQNGTGGCAHRAARTCPQNGRIRSQSGVHQLTHDAAGIVRRAARTCSQNGWISSAISGPVWS